MRVLDDGLIEATGEAISSERFLCGYLGSGGEAIAGERLCRRPPNESNVIVMDENSDGYWMQEQKGEGKERRIYWSQALLIFYFGRSGLCIALG